MHKRISALSPAVDWFAVYLLDEPPWFECDRVAAFVVTRPYKSTSNRPRGAEDWEPEDYDEVAGVVAVDDEGLHIAGEVSNFYCYVHQKDIPQLIERWVKEAKDRAAKTTAKETLKGAEAA